MRTTEWWSAPEYAKAQPMHFPEPGGRVRRIGTEVTFDTALGRWVSAPIRVYVGPSFR